MPFSEHLVFRKGSAEILLKDPVILVTNNVTVPRSENDGRTAYDNRNVKNFVARIISEVGSEDLATLRSFVPAAVPDDLNADVDEFCCPITLMPMNDPVVAIDGVTYEREALTRWLDGPSSQGRTPMRGRMIASGGDRLPMLQNLLLTALIDEHAARLQSEGVEYERAPDFSDFEAGRWADYLERAKLRFMVAFASGLVVTLALLRFLESLDPTQLVAISSGTTSIAVGTTVGSAAFTLASAVNIVDATVTSSTVLTDSTSVLFSNRGSRSTTAIPACAPGHNG